MARIWQNGNTFITTLDISVEVSLEDGDNDTQDPALPLLRIYSKYASYFQIGDCTTMFIAALLLITRIWKQHRCPSTDEWLKKKTHGLFVQWSITQLSKSEIKKILGKLMELEKKSS